MSVRYKYLIIGAGITGVTLARLLQLAGEEKFIILEKNDEVGGLCRTKIIDNHVIDVNGGHFLSSKYDEVYDFIFSHIPKNKFNFFNRVSKIELEGELIDYPVEASFWQLSDEKRKDYLQSIQEAGELKNAKEPSDYSEWIHWKFGDRIAEDYMIPYNIKIWGIDPKEMDIDWLHKIPHLDPHEVIKSMDTKVFNQDMIPSHKTFFYPRRGGFQEIFNSIFCHVMKKTICNCPVLSLKRERNSWCVNREFEAETVINTAPWPALYAALKIPLEIIGFFKKLHSNSIVISLFEKKYSHAHQWHYIPDLNVRHHREFFIHNFAPHSQKEGVSVETNRKRWRQGEEVSRFGMKPLFEFVNEAAYPIPTLGHSEAIERILGHYSKYNLFGLGRWGQWKYFNSDVCILETIQFVKNVLNLNF